MANEKLVRASDVRRAILKEDPKLAYCIDAVPGVDAMEVVHGRWNKVYTSDGVWLYIYLCDQCKGDHDKKSNYCPNCGAKMEGD